MRSTQSSPTAPRTMWVGAAHTPTLAAAIRTAVEDCSVHTAVRGANPARPQRSRKRTPCTTGSMAQRTQARSASSGRVTAERGLRGRGIDVRAGARLLDVEVLADGVRARVRTARGETRTLTARRLLVAVGRVPVTQGLELAAAGLATDARGFVVPADRDRLETAVPGIHVVGDLLPPPSLGLAHASFAEGLVVAETLAGLRPTPVDYTAVPRVTYSSPQTAAVGLTEAQARALGHEPAVRAMPLTALAKGMVHGRGGMVKVVAEAGGGRVLGVHLVGPQVSELIAETRLIVGWDAEPADVARHVHPHPTLSEAVGEVLLTLAGRGLHQR